MQKNPDGNSNGFTYCSLIIWFSGFWDVLLKGFLPILIFEQNAIPNKDTNFLSKHCNQWICTVYKYESRSISVRKSMRRRRRRSGFRFACSGRIALRIEQVLPSWHSLYYTWIFKLTGWNIIDVRLSEFSMQDSLFWRNWIFFEKAACGLF